MYVRNLGYTLLLQIGGSKTPVFRRLRNLTTTSTAYIFRTNMIYIIEQVRYNYQGSPTSSQNIMNFG